MERISNTDIKSLGSPKLSKNFTSQEQILPKPQPQEDYGIAKTDFLKEFNLKHLPENTKPRWEISYGIINGLLQDNKLIMA